ncbi:MFS transporter [bacterium]|nr:MFS transporter [bacterium]
MTDKATDRRGAGEVVAGAFRELGQTLMAFVKAPKALWGINVPYVIEGLVYFGILTILGKFCSENIDLTDQQAGWVYSGVTSGITLSMLFLGGVSDKIGVRRALWLAFGMFVVGRGMIALSDTLDLGQGPGSPMFFMTVLGLLVMVTAYGLYQPAAYAGVKRYTNKKTAAMGYAVVYGLMNLGAFFSGFISPLVRRGFTDVFPPNGLGAVFWAYVVLCVVALVVTLLVLTRKTDEEAVARVQAENASIAAKNREASGEPEPDATQAVTSAVVTPDINNLPFIILLGLSVVGFGLAAYQWVNQLGAFGIAIGAAIVLSVAAIAEYMRHRPDHPFRDARFTFFIFILIPVQTLFAHNWLTLPYYLDRAFRGGVVSEYFEFFSNLNPILIFLLAPIVAGLTARANIYRMMIIGTLVMALPTFLLALGPNVPLFLTYVLLMSVGEAMWQPRFLQWIAEIAPEGKTGMYMGIGQFPWFLTKFVTGLYSGFFVAQYLPDPVLGEPIRSGQMWFFHALIAMISPVALILAAKWMTGGMKERAGD